MVRSAGIIALLTPLLPPLLLRLRRRRLTFQRLHHMPTAA